jgi:hypothetical protein
VARRLGVYESGNALTVVKSHARRLGLDETRFVRPVPKLDKVLRDTLPASENLKHAGLAIAAAWFALRGWPSLIPAEGSVYDLVADVGSRLLRVQVKTVARRSKRGEWMVSIARSYRRNGASVIYDPDSIDLFFIIDGEMRLYLIPINAVVGQSTVNPEAYRAYRVGSARSLMAL